MESGKHRARSKEEVNEIVDRAIMDKRAVLLARESMRQMAIPLCCATGKSEEAISSLDRDLHHTERAHTHIGRS